MVFERHDLGVLWSYQFYPGEVAQALSPTDARSWLANPDSEGFLWLHLNLANNAALPWLKDIVPVPDAFIEALSSASRSTRIERDEDSLVGIVNDVSFDFRFEPTDTATMWLWADRRLLVTCRRQPLRTVDRLRGVVKAGETFRSSIDLLAHLMRDQADVLIDIVRKASEQVDDVEDQLLAGRLEAKRVRLGQWRRLLVRLQRLLAPEPGSLFRLLQHPPRWIPELDVLELRQSTEEFSVALRDIGALQERIKLLQEEIAAQVAESNNRSLFMLTVVTVLALPINMMAGLFGMNVGGVPFGEHRHGFAIVASVLVLATLLLAWLLLKNRDDR
ncbi:MAG: transporter [Inhella sp.]|jgi:zinc transporter|uniref:transporter n=1 Tax=Inhella sp. TaxID=1921806 RepID=UPI0022BB3491|nr:transporter [Inhella sp.]MCZ8233537.1 transporter [Inhella sp.]